jgi:hypothetical protein
MSRLSLALLIIYVIKFGFTHEEISETVAPHSIQCKLCGNTLTYIENVFNYESSKAKLIYNVTILNNEVAVQRFVNPQGNYKVAFLLTIDSRCSF